MDMVFETAALVQTWLAAHPALPIAAGVFSVIAFFGTLAAVPVILVRMRSDYFLPRHDDRHGGGNVQYRGRGYWRLLVVILKNTAGLVLLAAGILMLVLPGQGLLTVLIALTLLNFPGKRGLERRVISKPGVLRAVNSLRRRAGRAPLQLMETPRKDWGASKNG